MTNEQMRIRVNEHEGWKFIAVQDGYKFSDPSQPLMVHRWVNEKLNRVQRSLPPVDSDLNAVAVVIATLNAIEQPQYIMILAALLKARFPLEDIDWLLLTSTAAQRCLALCRLWGIKE